MTTRSTWWLPSVVLATVFLWWLAAPVARAHTEVVETTPSADASVDSGTASVLLSFSDRVLPDVVEASVTDATGRDHVVADPIVDGGRVLLPLEPLDDAGHYTVTYRVVAADGHAVTGSYGFDLSAQGAASADRVSTPTADGDPFDAAHAVGPQYGDPAGLPLPAWVVVGGGALGLVVLLRLAAGRQGEPSDPGGSGHVPAGQPEDLVTP